MRDETLENPLKPACFMTRCCVLPFIFLFFFRQIYAIFTIEVLLLQGAKGWKALAVNFGRAVARVVCGMCLPAKGRVG
jgi:hypothetical protein